jgi:MraZ protein
MLKSRGYTGRTDHKVDSKGRLSIPALIRKDIAPGQEDEVAVVYVPSGHLLLFNREYWDTTIQQYIIDQEDKIGKEKVWRAIHEVSENCHMSKVDSQGRVSIPRRMLEETGITSDAVIIGIFDRLSVWDPERYKKWKAEENLEPVISAIGLY